jgi:small subunit ribosomal protein S3Ae
MAKEEKKTSTTKLKKKRWFQILAPRLFYEEVIGETFVEDCRLVIGKNITVNLMNLTGDPKRQNINIKFIVTSLQGDKAGTQVVGYEVVPSSIKRMVRRGRDRIDASYLFETADNHKVRIKPFLLTKSSTKGGAMRTLQKEMYDFLLTTIKKLDYSTLVKDIVSYKLQNSLREKLSKIYPLSACGIRVMKLERKQEEDTEKSEASEKRSISEPAKKEELPAEEKKPDSNTKEEVTKNAKANN